MATSDLFSRLDDLLERYLGLLDEYTSLHEAMSKQFSEGFFTLARAQRTSSLGSGRRYGQDGYDQRMKATKRIKLTGAHHGVPSSIMDGSTEAVTTFESTTYEAHLPEISKSVEWISDAHENETPTKKDKPTESTMPSQENNLKADPGYRDPASWYGLLIPPLLRQAQFHFTKNIDDTIPSLLSTRALMKSLEGEINDLRARLGISYASREVPITSE